MFKGLFVCWALLGLQIDLFVVCGFIKQQQQRTAKIETDNLFLRKEIK